MYIPLEKKKEIVNDPGDVYYVFPKTNEGITSLEDESTIDPFTDYRDGKMPWENLP